MGIESADKVTGKNASALTAFHVAWPGSEDGAPADGEQRASRSRRSTRKVTDFALMHEGNTRELTAKVHVCCLAAPHTLKFCCDFDDGCKADTSACG